jgi:hypothetical protein
MNTNRMPKIMMNYGPNGRKVLEDFGRELLTRPKQVSKGLTGEG